MTPEELNECTSKVTFEWWGDNLSYVDLMTRRAKIPASEKIDLADDLRPEYTARASSFLAKQKELARPKLSLATAHRLLLLTLRRFNRRTWKRASERGRKALEKLP